MMTESVVEEQDSQPSSTALKRVARRMPTTTRIRACTQGIAEALNLIELAHPKICQILAHLARRMRAWRSTAHSCRIPLWYSAAAARFGHGGITSHEVPGLRSRDFRLRPRVCREWFDCPRPGRRLAFSSNRPGLALHPVRTRGLHAPRQFMPCVSACRRWRG